MSDFRPGDRFVVIAGQVTRLRLSVSALAEFADMTGSDSPAALAKQLRRGGDMAVWQGMAKALATPRPKGSMSSEDMAQILPDIAAVITEGLGA